MIIDDEVVRAFDDYVVASLLLLSIYGIKIFLICFKSHGIGCTDYRSQSCQKLLCENFLVAAVFWRGIAIKTA